MFITKLFFALAVPASTLAAETFIAPYAGWDCKGSRPRGNVGLGEIDSGKCINFPSVV